MLFRNDAGVFPERSGCCGEKKNWFFQDLELEYVSSLTELVMGVWLVFNIFFLYIFFNDITSTAGYIASNELMVMGHLPVKEASSHEPYIKTQFVPRSEHSPSLL
jgi:hypothetical protein